MEITVPGIIRNGSKFHWKTIENKFRLWSRLNVFEIAYNKLLSDNVLSKLNKSTTLSLFIDSADITNINGSELTGYGKNKKKKQTKVSFIADANRQVYGVSFYTPNIPDVKTLISSIDQIKDKFKYRKINLTSDKGYISEQIKKELEKVNVNLMYPHKKNMKTKTPKKYKKFLRKRYLIEHTIRDNKKNNRIQLRREKLIQTYRSFLYLSMIINLQKFINKHSQKNCIQ
jgi:hypothetical protein